MTIAVRHWRMQEIPAAEGLVSDNWTAATRYDHLLGEPIYEARNAEAGLEPPNGLQSVLVGVDGGIKGIPNSVGLSSRYASHSFSSSVFKISVFSYTLKYTGNYVSNSPEEIKANAEVVNQDAANPKTVSDVSANTPKTLNLSPFGLYSPTDSGRILTDLGLDKRNEDGVSLTDQFLATLLWDNQPSKSSTAVGEKEKKAAENNQKALDSLTDPNNTYTPDPAKRVQGQGNYEYEAVATRNILDMHVPPSEISWQYQQELIKNKVRGGWVIERWGENMIQIEASGTSGVFYHSKEGLTRVGAYSTYGFQEIMDLAQLYRNNGLSYDPVSGVVYTVGDVRIEYDGTVYIGSFDSFDIKESADKPFAFTYSFTFVGRGDSKNVVMLGHSVQNLAPSNTKENKILPSKSKRKPLSDHQVRAATKAAGDSATQGAKAEVEISGEGFSSWLNFNHSQRVPRSGDQIDVGAAEPVKQEQNILDDLSGFA